MKYLAILKDSVREAIDTKVLYVMLVLSGLLILVVASLSFRPTSVAEDIDKFTKTFEFAFSFHKAQGGPVPEFSHSEVRQLNPGVEPWKGNYDFTLTVKWPDEKKRFQNFSPATLRFVLTEALSSYLDNVKIVDSPSQDPRESSWHVTSEGTKIDNVRGWKHEPSLLFGALPLRLGPISFEAPLGEQVYFVENRLVNGAGAWIGILAGIIITAFFIPNMLRKGTIDLLLVRPLHRVTLLVFKFLGGLSFMLFISTFTVVGIWLALGLRTGIWAPGFLLTIFVLTFFFAILYAVSTLASVLTHSPIVAILVSFLTWGLLLGINWLYVPADQVAEARKTQDVPAMPAAPPAPDAADDDGAPSEFRQRGRLLFPDWVYTTVQVAHYALPRTADLNALTSRLIMKNVLLDDNPRLAKLDKTTFSWGESLTVSGLFIVVLLGFACLRFSFADY